MIALLLLGISHAEACVENFPETTILPANGSAVSEQPILLVFYASQVWSEKNSHIQLFDEAGSVVPIDVRQVGWVADVRPRERLEVGKSYQLVLWPSTARTVGALGIRATRVHVVANDQPVGAAPVLRGAIERTPSSYHGDCGWSDGGVYLPVESPQPFTAYGVWDRPDADLSKGPDWWALGDGTGVYVEGGTGFLFRGVPYGRVTLRSLGVDGRLSEGATISTSGAP